MFLASSDLVFKTQIRDHFISEKECPISEFMNQGKMKAGSTLFFFLLELKKLKLFPKFRRVRTYDVNSSTLLSSDVLLIAALIYTN